MHYGKRAPMQMSFCDIAEPDFSSPYWILVESEDRKLLWTSACINRDHCHLCNTSVGGLAFIESGVNEVFFGKYKASEIKVIARIERII